MEQLNRTIESDGTLVNISNGNPKDPNFVSQSIQAAMGIGPTGNISSEFNDLNNLLSRLSNGEEPEQIFRELQATLTSRNFR